MQAIATINDAIKAFPAIIDQHVKNIPRDIGVLAKKIAQLRSAPAPDVFDDAQIKEFLQQRAQAAKALLDSYIHAKFSATMPMLSPEMFSLTREVTVSWRDKTPTITADNLPNKSLVATSEENQSLSVVSIPLFACVKLFEKDHVADLGTCKKVTRSVNRWEERTRSTTTATLRAKLPGTIGKNLRAHYAKALSMYHALVSELLSDETISAMYLANPLPDPEIVALWIPPRESLVLSVKTDVKVFPNPKNFDPAMVMKIGEHHFLVTTWQVDDEEPFDHFLREYSTTPLNPKKSS